MFWEDFKLEIWIWLSLIKTKDKYNSLNSKDNKGVWLTFIVFFTVNLIILLI